MYLSVRQHDQLRTVVMNVEIPLRTYIASTILKKFASCDAFTTVLQEMDLLQCQVFDHQVINTFMGQFKKNPSRIFGVLEDIQANAIAKDSKEEIYIPKVAELYTLVMIFRDSFQGLFLRFKDDFTFQSQFSKYRYIRNKLSHPNYKSIEKSDMDIVLDFILTTCSFLNTSDTQLFQEKSYSDMLFELRVLQEASQEIPIGIHNISDIPFPDMRIVCRENEISFLKEFIYGKPGALRKKASLSVFGYGGVGKTALVLETIKEVIRDIRDKNVTNNYTPSFLLFFSAKEEALSLSYTSGAITRMNLCSCFHTADELISEIYIILGIDSFVGFNNAGLIIIDNLETLSDKERLKIKDFIQFSSPQQIQYIITSRNEEHYEERLKLAGFSDYISGEQFISSYIEENDITLELTASDMRLLLDISKGNTLVLVLSLLRLGMNLTSLQGIAQDITNPVSIKKIDSEMQSLPPSGFNIISEFMFKNTFLEIEDLFSSEKENIYSVLKLFAIHQGELDLYTVTELTGIPYVKALSIIDILCKYLIIEHHADFYSLNQFAEKYIIQRFLPDAETLRRVTADIELNLRKIRADLETLEYDIKRNDILKRIIRDWAIITNGDKIAAAKAYSLYGIAKRACSAESRFKIEHALTEVISELDGIEKNTMHPYIKFPRARILLLIHNSKYLDIDLIPKIITAYDETIWVIKQNSLYSSVKLTKSYASVLWLYGTLLYDQNDLESYHKAARYLEEAQAVFEQQTDRSDEYFQCLVRLGRVYLMIYIKSETHDVIYLRRARTISSKLLREKQLNYITRKHANQLSTDLSNIKL